MNFNGNFLSISDEEFGCTLSIYENEEKEYDGDDEEEEDEGNYLLLQRTYAEDDSEKDYQYIESNIEGISGDNKNVEIEINPSKLSLSNPKMKIEIILSKTLKNKFEDLKNALQKIGKNTWKINIHEN